MTTRAYAAPHVVADLPAGAERARAVTTRAARAALPRLVDLRGAAWALQATLSARRQLRLGPAEAVRLRTSARLPAAAGRGVHAVLRRLEPSCLERALVLQSWLRAHGESRALVIGVTAPTRDFRAHAWIEGEPAPGFTEIARLVA